MQIRDLEQWPPSVWVTSGFTKLTPDLATAIIKDVQLGEKSVALSLNDQGQEYNITIGPFDQHCAMWVVFRLWNAIGKTVQDAGELEILDYSLFESKDIHGNVVFNFSGRPIEDLAAFADGYHKAGQHLAAQLASSVYGDYEGYPILFLYRHALELYLKAIVYQGGLLVGVISGKEIDDVPGLFGCHQLDKLLRPLEAIFKALDWDLEGTALTSFEDFAQVIKTIQGVDPRSYVFRYPITGKRKVYFPPGFILNVVSFARRMDGILEFLSNAANGIPEQLRENEQARYELEQYFGAEGE
jgi:hypothetical protein